MNFVEKIFGVSPDGGSGSLEILLFLIPLAGLVALRMWRRHWRSESTISRRRQ